MRKNKYNAKKTIINGIKFDSKREAQRYKELKELFLTNMIDDLELQVPYILIEKSKYGRAVKYVADFRYFSVKTQKTIVEDVKGYKTDVYKLKKRLMAEKYGIEIKEV